MGYLIVGAVVFIALYGAAGRKVLQRYANWRLATAILAVGLFAAAGFTALRGGEGKAIVLAVIGMALTASSRWPRAPRPATAEVMSAAQARSLLGVSAQASTDDIRAAYGRLIQKVHPDRGGSAGLAVQLNLARDVLLKR